MQLINNQNNVQIHVIIFTHTSEHAQICRAFEIAGVFLEVEVRNPSIIIAFNPNGQFTLFHVVFKLNQNYLTL